MLLSEGLGELHTKLDELTGAVTAVTELQYLLRLSLGIEGQGKERYIST
jgi:hypothetical protein